MKKNWYTIKALSTLAGAASDAADTVEITIHDAIGGWNINAQSFINDLRAQTAKNIKLSINSPGGSVIDGIAIFNALRNYVAQSGGVLTTATIGIAASIANYIAQAGDVRQIAENAFYMVHKPLNAIYDNADGLREMADLLDKFESSIVNTYIARTGRTQADIEALLRDETLMTAQEALDAGFVDEITPALTLSASFELDNLPENIQSIFKATSKAITADNTSAPAKPESKQIIPPEANGTTFAASVIAIAKQYGIEAHAESLLLDLSLTTVDQVTAAAIEAREIIDLCVFAKLPDAAKQLIANRKTLVDAREKLIELKAEASDNTHVDNTAAERTNDVAKPVHSAIDTTAIYQARKQRQSKKEK